MMARLRRSQWKSTACQLTLHGQCDGIVRWLGEKTENACPCTCHRTPPNPGVSGEGDSW